MWGCPSGMIAPMMDMGQGLPGALCTKDTLAGQLKLTWEQIGVPQDGPLREHPGSGSGAEVSPGWGVLECSVEGVP